MFALRDYQETAVASIRLGFRTHDRVLLVSPTGSGKTITFAYISNSAASRGKRIVIVAHRREIVRQISAALTGMGVRHGLIMPGHGMTADPVQVGMVQTIARRLDRVPAPDLLVIDEAHHGVAGSWRKLLDAWRTKVLGVTATPERLDGKGLGDVFDAMVEGPAAKDLIAAGHLAGYDYYAPPSQADLSSIKTRMGDYAISDLAVAMDRATITGDAVEHYRQHLNGRPAIAFCVTVEHAEHVAAQFRSQGFRSASVDGAMEQGKRDRIVGGLSTGEVQVLTSCELISEGFDVPAVAGAILLRPTKSLSMFLQQVGRALRKKDDGSRAVILDHVGNVHRHGMPDAPRAWSLDGRSKDRDAPQVSTCQLCFQTLPAIVVRSPSFACGGIDGYACPFTEAREDDGADGRPQPQFVAGKLERMPDPLAWAQGIDLSRARGAEWRALLDLADTEEKLKQIARARGYKRGWIQHVMRERASGGTGGSDFQAREWRAA